MAQVLEISPLEARARLSDSKDAVLIDVREPEEFAMARLEGSRLVPMRAVPAQLPQLKALADDADLLVLCHHGVRSLQVVSWLRGQGLENCYSVAGGIDRWSEEVDPAVPRY
jgi:rhodanese-related sulfurtransferase